MGLPHNMLGMPGGEGNSKKVGQGGMPLKQSKVHPKAYPKLYTRRLV